MEDDEWEVCNLWHDVKHGKGKHEIRLSIHKECDYRLTFCRVCGRSVKFYRKPAEGTEQTNQPDSQYDLGGLILPGSVWAEP